jgi:hypothetical protein
MSRTGARARRCHVNVAFRNVDARPSDPVATWPYEALVTAIDRGLVSDWQPIFAEIRRLPWGPTARRVERYLSYRESDGVSTLFGLAIERARRDAESAERDAVARRVSAAIARSGLTADAFARLVGTSPSRLSTYVNGRVVPSATLMARIESVADR